MQTKVVDAELRKAVCCCVATGCGVPTGAVAIEGFSSGQHGATFALSLLARHVLREHQAASVAKVLLYSTPSSSWPWVC